MSGSANNLPIRISVDGVPQAEAAFNSIAATGERAMARVSQGTQAAGSSFGGLRNVVGQAGFQIQDFAVQVQGGTSALTALSQQGSQMLGVFGPAGAIAGAILTVGILAARLFDVGKATEDAAFAAGAYTRAMQASNEVLATANERSRQEAANKRREAQEALGLAIAIERETLARGNAAAARLAADDADAARLREQGGGVPDQFSRSGARREAATRIATAAEQASQRLVALQTQLDALGRQGVDLGGGQFGPSGDGLAAAETLRRSLDERYRIQADYQARMAEIRRLAADGVIQGNEIAQREAQALEQRNRALETVANRGVRQPREGNQTFDVRAAIERSPAIVAQRELDAYNQSLNLQDAGLTNAAGALRAYEEGQRALTRALENNVITEAEFALRVADGSEALARQLDVIRRRGDGGMDVGRQLGLTFTSAFESAITSGKSFGDVLTSLGEDLAKLILRFTVMEPLAKSVRDLFNNSGTSGGGSAAGDLLSRAGSAITSAFGGLFGGARANGGPVLPGRAYLVGERGPEIATFGASGQITPNHALGGSTFAPVYNIDARGADASVVPMLRAEMRAIAAQSLAQFTDSIRRGGSGARLVGR